MSAPAVEEAPMTGEQKGTTASNSPVLWSEVLATPTSGDLFSPARQMDKECLHGAGLQKALDHGKMVARGGRRCALMLLEGASCYEQFGVALMKACQANPLEGEAFKSISSLSQQTRQLSTQLREEIATPLQGYHTNIGETFPTMHQKYALSRQKAYGARQRALLARTKYLKAVQEAEQACSLVQKETNTNTPESASTKVEWDKTLEEYGTLKGSSAADRVTDLLNDVKVLQRRYEGLVEKENNAVKLAQTMESVALEGIQKLEEQRLCVFYDGLVRTFEEIKVSLDNLIISAEVGFDESSREQVKVVHHQQNQKKGDFFSTILKVGAAEEQTGVADAEALGLDEDVGTLRDEVQTRIASRLARYKKVKALAALFVDMASAAGKLGTGLQQMVKHEDSYVSTKGTPVEHLRSLLSNCEGPRTLNLWNDLMKTMEREGEAFLQLSRVLGSIKSSKLDQFLSTNEKDIKEMAEQDDARWKHLCDAARTEMRAETKYRQSTVQTAKARERMGSVDHQNQNAEIASAKSPQKQNRAMNGMNKAFGNFLSILPDGGEQAMQILSPDARKAVVEKQVAEADEKELKVKQAYDNAVAYKNRTVESYRSNAQPLVKRYEIEEMSGVEDVKAAMESVLDCLKTLRISRYETLGPLSELGDQPLVSALVDLQEWVGKASKDTEAKKPATAPSDAVGTSGFMLMLVLAESEKAKQVLEFARIGTTDSFESDCSERSGSQKDDASVTSGPTIEVSVGPESNRSLDLKSVKPEEAADKDKGDTKNGAQWLKKSFSTPIGKPSGFKPFRKLHSTGDIEADAADDQTETSTISTAIPPQNSQEISETELFSSFWPDYEGAPPGVTNSFACAFLPKDCTVKNVAGVEHGRLFLTHKGAVFVAWKGKKAVVYFALMTNVEKNDNLFGLAEDTFLISAQSKGVDSTLLLSCFNQRDQALEIVQSRMEAAKKARAESDKAHKAEGGSPETAEKQAPTKPVAPDTMIDKMETVLSKKIRGIPISRFHDIVWLDKTSDDTFYGGWLGQGSCSDIKVSEWETSDDGFTGGWCGEKYSHKRQLSFQLKRNSMIGPPVAGVKQTQYCRVDGNDRSVMMMTVAFEGIPYSDCFTVEVRWVATRTGVKDINVQVGVFVEFHQSTFLKSQIRNGTMSETKPVHESLFAHVKAELSKEVSVEEEAGGAGQEEEEEEEEEETLEKSILGKEEGMVGMIKENMHIAGPALGILLFVGVRWFFSSAQGSSSDAAEIARLNGKIDNLQTEMKLMRQAVEQLTSLMKDQIVQK